MAPLLQTVNANDAGARVGVDLFSVRSQKWTLRIARLLREARREAGTFFRASVSGKPG